ncbi:hypothetical protein K502DRAFT_347998 [Neoconidiobolus thromboides FSU 785]|nr:hypothetical protein K502DRAFT_347998 [Neoconidiobolus thromboides FSU 785]
MLPSIKNIQKFGIRKTALQLLTFLTVVSSAFMMWKGLAWYTNTESPVVVVLT